MPRRFERNPEDRARLILSLPLVRAGPIRLPIDCSQRRAAGRWVGLAGMGCTLVANPFQASQSARSFPFLPSLRGSADDEAIAG
jgi:hypothetical protein